MADRYLVATGNWNDTASWSDETGGDPGASVPGSGDNVFLDANSGAVTLTVNVSSACLNFDCTGFTGTLEGSQTLSVWGTVFKLVAGMTHTSGLAVTFRSTSGTTQITCAGKNISGIFTLNGSGGTFQLQDKLALASIFTRTAGTFDANGQDVLFYNINATINGETTFYNLERKPTTASSGRTLSLSSNITVTNNLVLDSNSTDADKRLLITSDTRGTQRTITCNGTVTANYCDFEDIAGAGSASWDLSAATGGSGDCGGNSDITFTTADDCFQVGAAGNFSAVTWSTSTGGATGQRVPLPQDTAILDANSTTGTMTQNLQRIGSITCTGFTGTLTTSTACTCYGSITLSSGMTLTGSTQGYTLAGRGAHTLTSAGKSWAKAFTIDAPGGSYTLQGDFASGATSLLALTQGTFDANDYHVTLGGLYRSGGATAVLDMGNGTWTMSGVVANNAWNVTSTTGLTITPGASTIKFTGAPTAFREQSMAGTYNNVEFATTGSYGFIVRYAPTFNNFKVAPGSNVQFYRSETVTAASWTLEGTSDDPITLASDTTTAATIAKSGGGTVTIDYATITYLTGSPISTFSATNSIDGGNNSQIDFITSGYRPSVIFID
jgi:hypothetical protein